MSNAIITKAIADSISTGGNTVEITYSREIEAELERCSDGRMNAGGLSYLYSGESNGRDWSVLVVR